MQAWLEDRMQTLGYKRCSKGGYGRLWPVGLVGFATNHGPTVTNYGSKRQNMSEHDAGECAGHFGRPFLATFEQLQFLALEL